MRLAKQKHEIAMRKKELEIQIEQMALQDLEEDHRQRVAAAKLDEAELMDSRSLFIHHSNELNLLKDRGSDRSQRLVKDWVNSLPPGNSLTAASELNFSRPGSATADPPVQDTAPSNPPENRSNVAGNLNHLEMLSQYKMPGVAISCSAGGAVSRIPQCSNSAIWQWQKNGPGLGVDQANSHSGSGIENPGNQGQTALQNFAPPSLLPPMQSPGHRLLCWHQHSCT